MSNDLTRADGSAQNNIVSNSIQFLNDTMC